MIGAGERPAFSESHLGSAVSVALSLGAPTLALGGQLAPILPSGNQKLKIMAELGLNPV